MVEVSWEVIHCLWQELRRILLSSGTSGLLKIKAVGSFVSSVSARSITQRHITVDLDLQQHRYENFKSRTENY